MAHNLKLTPPVAQRISADLSRIGDLFTNMHEVLGIHPGVAQDFARKCAFLQHRVCKNAGMRVALSEDPPLKTDYPKTGPSWDPEQIGVEKPGALEGDTDEKPYMGDQFTQQENRELRERQEKGDLSKLQPIEEEQAPTPGKQATLDETLEKLAETNTAISVERLKDELFSLQKSYHKAASVLGKSPNRDLKIIAGSLAHIASELGQAVLSFEGTHVNPYMRKTFERMARTASETLPHIRPDLPSEHWPKLAELVELTANIVTA